MHPSQYTHLHAPSFSKSRWYNLVHAEATVSVYSSTIYLTNTTVKIDIQISFSTQTQCRKFSLGDKDGQYLKSFSLV